MAMADTQVVPGFGVFASGKGSNFMRLHEYFTREHPESGRIVCLVSDKPECGAAAYARQAGIPVILISYKGRQKDEAEAEVLSQLSGFQPRLLVLAGFMRILGPTLVDAYPKKIINIHPSLLPRHAGAHAIEESFASGDQNLGISIHYVDHGLDSGPLIIQKSFFRNPDEDLEKFEAHIHRLEHETYPLVVKGMLDGMRKS